ncbi:MAG: PDZ domain-containing protein [Vicinamibacterales bacterium]
MAQVWVVRVRWCAAVVALLAGVPGLSPRSAAQPSATDPLWHAYWQAGSPADATRAADRLRAAGVTFDAAWTRLKAGRPYGAAPTGERSLRASGPGGVAFDNYVEVPESYDPARKWPVRVQLHGGVDRPRPEEGRRRRPNRLPGEPQIVIHPFAWGEVAWWHGPQVENVLGLVDRVKRQYNVDESRIYLTGTSDGATGAYFLAMREATPWSAVLPLIGHLAVLANPSTGADGDLFVSNLVNKPFFVVNGVRDPLYPAMRVAPYLETLVQAGVSLTFHPQPTGGHDTSWWESERPAFEAFVRDHPRPAHPPLLSWTTERTDRYHRIQWLVIDELGDRASDSALADANTFRERYDPDFGLRGDSRREQGTRVVQVVPESDAAKMGLAEGDRILEIDGRPIAALADILAAFERNSGPAIVFVVERGAERLTLKGAFPPEAPRGPARRLFARRGPSGRVDVVRRGNTFEARTRGVARFTLLLSPDVVDFSAPVVVTVNGRPVHEGVVARDLATLLTWAARDDDRTMLYGAALPIAVP